MYICNDCPRNCGIDKAKEKGFCNMGLEPKIARASVHLWEEPPISMGKGSGTVFFSGCNLKCEFCQNKEISKKHTLYRVCLRLKHYASRFVGKIK